MDYRGLVVTVVIASAAVLPLIPACKAPDPGEITFIARTGGANPADQNGDATSSGSAGTDAGGTTTSSGGTEGGAVTADTIFGTDAFKFSDPMDSANAEGTGVHTPPMQGKACLQGGCHGDPGAAGTKWAVAGTVYADVGGTALAAGAQIEIRVVGPDGTAVTGGSFSPDKDGNFWLDNAGAAIQDGSHVAIRTATTEMKMNTALTAAKGANCSDTTAGCHGSATFRIHIP